MKIIAQLLVLLLVAGIATAHPMPNSVLLLDVMNDGVAAELQWPLKEFQLAFPAEDIDTHPATLIDRKGHWLDEYLTTHFSVTDQEGHPWTVRIRSRSVKQTQQSLTGTFSELVFQLWLQPPAGVSPRHFTLHYDAIMHQVLSHKMFISLRQDWDGGLSAKDSTDADLGILMMDQGLGKVPPVIINLDEGSKWKGFKNMVSLGIQHISEGTDHLLFLLVLMLPAPLLAAKGRWNRNGSARHSVILVAKIATAFTIGHSLTLLAGALGWLRLPSQPVEVLIAISILVSAVHALRPLFPGREMLVAAGFGLVHGLAFASTLANLHLDGLRMSLSILGFNLGIELMQVFVLLLFMPWLIMLGEYPLYKWVRITGASFALIASLAWIAERTLQVPNPIATIVQSVAMQGQWIVLALAATASAMRLLHKPGATQ